MPVKRGSGGLDWQQDALCALPENQDMVEYFFSSETDERYEAKNLCFACDVRADCVRWALENNELWGIWGGRDEQDIRRTLSVDSEGNETRRGRFPQCPYCGARTSRLRTKTIDIPNGGRWRTARAVECTSCGFQWQSRSSANAIDLYYRERDEKRQKNAAVRNKIAEKQEAREARIRAEEREKREAKRDKERIKREAEQQMQRDKARAKKEKKYAKLGRQVPGRKPGWKKPLEDGQTLEIEPARIDLEDEHPSI